MIKILSKKIKEIIKKTKKEIKKQIIKEVKKEFLDEQIKTNQDIKDEIKKNKDLYDTKMIMFKTFGVSNDIYNIFLSITYATIVFTTIVQGLSTTKVYQLLMSNKKKVNASVE